MDATRRLARGAAALGYGPGASTKRALLLLMAVTVAALAVLAAVTADSPAGEPPAADPLMPDPAGARAEWDPRRSRWSACCEWTGLGSRSRPGPPAAREGEDRAMHEGTTSHKLDRRSDHRSEPDDRDHHRPEADPDWAVDEVLATAGGPSDEVPVSQEVRLEDFALEFWGYNRQQVADALQNLTARLAAVTQKLAAAAQLRIELREARQEIARLRAQVAHPPEWPGRLVELIQEAERLREQAERDVHVTQSKRSRRS